MTMLEWAIIGSVILAGLVLCFRIMRNGISTLDDDRSHLMERIRLHELMINEDKKNISAKEHMDIVESAIKDLIHLDGLDSKAELHRQGNFLLLETPFGPCKIEQQMHEKRLHSTNRIIHGRCAWRVIGKDIDLTYGDMAELMKCLNLVLTGDEMPLSQLPHIYRRYSGEPGGRSRCAFKAKRKRH